MAYPIGGNDARKVNETREMQDEFRGVSLRPASSGNLPVPVRQDVASPALPVCISETHDTDLGEAGTGRSGDLPHNPFAS